MPTINDPEVRLDDHRNAFQVKGEIDDLDAFVTSDLILDSSSSHYRFEIVPLVRRHLSENMILEIWLRGQETSRVGWLIPANALSSNEHGFANNPHFRRYAFMAMQSVLEHHRDLYRQSLSDHQLAGNHLIPFADLFHDDIAFLVICLDLAEADGEFDSASLIPTLVSYGYVPLEYCSPGTLDWRCRDIDPGMKNLKIRPTSSALSRIDLPARLFAVAASARHSTVTQFFYLYQVVELLLEEMLIDTLADIGQSVSGSIRLHEYMSLKDQLEGLSAQLGEKGRLKTLMKSFEGGDAALRELAAASDRFLRSVGMKPKEGIDGLYQVRNYVVHQVRNMSKSGEELLENVVLELAAFLPTILGSIKLSRHVLERPLDSLNAEYRQLVTS